MHAVATRLERWSVATSGRLKNNHRNADVRAHKIKDAKKGEYMPVITRFYGILIKMYFNEHGIPHFHAVYGEFNGVFKIQTIEMIEGDLPLRAQKMVKDWAKTYQEELIKMWKKREYKQLPGLK